MTDITAESSHDLAGAPLTGERADLLETLGKHRFLLLKTAEGLTDEQAASTPTVSQLSVGGVIKHLTRVESRWASFMLGDVEVLQSGSIDEHLASFRMLPDDTLADLLARYHEVTGRTEALLHTVDLDSAHPLPKAPWFPPGDWTARRVLLHILAETAQHAGHADIIRESIDGAKTMG